MRAKNNGPEFIRAAAFDSLKLIPLLLPSP
jgi:hypothetical protein